MSESFFRRWARRKGEAGAPAAGHELEGITPDRRARAEPGAGDTPATSDKSTAVPIPTMHDVARLAPDSDYAPFLAPQVGKAVRLAALRKLFSDPHFNRMDGLDIYIDDYTRPAPLTAAMRATLKHARGLLDTADAGRNDAADREGTERTLSAGEASAQTAGRPAPDAIADTPASVDLFDASPVAREDLANLDAARIRPERP
jgi:hypothetical protein